MSSKSSKSKPTHIYASLSIAIVLFLLGIFLILFIHSQNLANLLKEKVNIVVELDNTSAKDRVLKQLKSIDEILPESVRYIDKDEGLEFMLGGSDVTFSDGNPLKDLVIFNVRSTSYSEAILKQIKSDLIKTEGVSTVFYENRAIDNIKENITRFATIILVLGLIFIFLAVVIIRNTINLSMYADREEIITLERIGARWSFIKMPYIKSSVLVGFKGFLIAMMAWIALLVATAVKLPAVWQSLNLLYIMVSFALLLIVAVMIPALVSNAAATRYLKK